MFSSFPTLYPLLFSLVSKLYLNDVGIGPAFMGLVVLRILEQDLVHVGAGVLKQLVRVVKDDESDLAVAQDTQLIGLLHQTKFPLGEGHLREGEKGNGSKEKNNKIHSFYHLTSILIKYCKL